MMNKIDIKENADDIKELRRDFVKLTIKSELNAKDTAILQRLVYGMVLYLS